MSLSSGPLKVRILLTGYSRGCHRIDGAGGSIGPDLAGIFERRPLDWIRVQIQTPKEHNSKTLMPIFGLSDSDVTAIIEALRQAR